MKKIDINLVHLLAALRKGTSITNIADDMGVSRGLIYKHLGELETRGIVVKDEKSPNKKGRSVYRLTNPVEEIFKEIDRQKELVELCERETDKKVARVREAWGKERERITSNYQQEIEDLKFTNEKLFLNSLTQPHKESEARKLRMLYLRMCGESPLRKAIAQKNTQLDQLYSLIKAMAEPSLTRSTFPSEYEILNQYMKDHKSSDRKNITNPYLYCCYRVLDIYNEYPNRYRSLFPKKKPDKVINFIADKYRNKIKAVKTENDLELLRVRVTEIVYGTNIVDIMRLLDKTYFNLEDTLKLKRQ